MVTVLQNANGTLPSPGIPTTQTGQYAYVAVSPNGHRLQVDAQIVSGTPSEGVAVTTNSGTRTVPTAGTAVTLANTSVKVGAVVITPLRTNTNNAYVGFTGGAGAQHIAAPVTLVAPDGKYLDLNLIYVDVTVNGEGVAYEAIS